MIQPTHVMPHNCTAPNPLKPNAWHRRTPQRQPQGGGQGLAGLHMHKAILSILQQVRRGTCGLPAQQGAKSSQAVPRHTEIHEQWIKEVYACISSYCTCPQDSSTHKALPPPYSTHLGKIS